MSNTQQPEALRLADALEKCSLNSLLSPLMELATELRRQHARIEELEAQLSAIGAGGVEPLRKQAAHPENIREGAPYDNPEFEQLARDMGVWGTPQAALCAQFWLAATQAEVPQGWKLVPVEPTEKMISEGCCAQTLKDGHRYIGECAAKTAWSFMLAAAPTPPAQGMYAANEWEDIRTLPTCDDLIWLYCQDSNTIDGPIAPEPNLEEYGWSHWAYANAPSTAWIDTAQTKNEGEKK